MDWGPGRGWTEGWDEERTEGWAEGWSEGPRRGRTVEAYALITPAGAERPAGPKGTTA
ncbi:hypothetical protein TPA0906_68380 [Streptomyces olivaceus]|nr:hypothetical protein TPA0906_68380 [Streptomyces olivaceus]